MSPATPEPMFRASVKDKNEGGGEADVDKSNAERGSEGLRVGDTVEAAAESEDAHGGRQDLEDAVDGVQGFELE